MSQVKCSYDYLDHHGNTLYRVPLSPGLIVIGVGAGHVTQVQLLIVVY